MARIFINDKAVKVEKEVTILNWFSQADGVTIFIRDTRPDTYMGTDCIRADIDTYAMGGDYYLDFNTQKSLDDTVLGLFVSEGSDFTFVTGGKDPLFIVKQKANIMSLGMMPSMNKGIDSDEVAMGVFFEGAVISYRLNGHNISDELTNSGWKRIAGPSNTNLGVSTTEEAFATKISNDKKALNNEAEDIQKLKEALLRDDVDKTVIKALLKSKEHSERDTMHIFPREDMLKLKKLGII